MNRKLKIAFFTCSFGKSFLSCILSVVSFLLTLSGQTGPEDERINRPALSCMCGSGREGRLNQERSVPRVNWNFANSRIEGSEEGGHFIAFRNNC